MVSEHFSDLEKLIREQRYSAGSSLESVPPIVTAVSPKFTACTLHPTCKIGAFTQKSGVFCVRRFFNANIDCKELCLYNTRTCKS